MDIIDFPNGDGNYIKRLVKEILPGLGFLVVVCLIGSLFAPGNFFISFASVFVLFSIIGILTGLKECKYYLTKVSYTNGHIKMV